jgi:hypothetical protein
MCEIFLYKVLFFFARGYFDFSVCPILAQQNQGVEMPEYAEVSLFFGSI